MLINLEEMTNSNTSLKLFKKWFEGSRGNKSNCQVRSACNQQFLASLECRCKCIIEWSFQIQVALLSWMNPRRVPSTCRQSQLTGVFHPCRNLHRLPTHHSQHHLLTLGLHRYHCSWDQLHTELQEPAFPSRNSLTNFGFTDDDVCKVVGTIPNIQVLSDSRVMAVLKYLEDQVGSRDHVVGLVLRYPEALTIPLELKVKPAVGFLHDVGLDDDAIAAVLFRFPFVIGYGVKSHLIPQMHYLLSLGICKEDLPRLIEKRPQVLGNYIEPVISYLKRIGLKRTQIGSLLETYPIDYSFSIANKDGFWTQIYTHCMHDISRSAIRPTSMRVNRSTS